MNSAQAATEAGQQQQLQQQQPPPPLQQPHQQRQHADESIEGWLTSFHPSLEQYAQGLVAYGYDDTSVLEAATEEDIEEAMGELQMKKPHRRLFVRAIAELRQT